MSTVVNISVNYERLNTQVGFKIVSNGKIELQVTEPVQHTCGKSMSCLDDVAEHLHIESQDRPRFMSLFSSETERNGHFVVRAAKIECHSYHSHKV